MKSFSWATDNFLIKLICCIYAFALLLPVYNTNHTVNIENESIVIFDSIRGFACLFGGFPFVSGFHLAWLANMTFIVSLCALHKSQRSLTIGSTVCSILLAVQAPRFIGETLRIGPGGIDEHIISMGSGFYIWVFALALPGLISFALICTRDYVRKT